MLVKLFFNTFLKLIKELINSVFSQLGKPSRTEINFQLKTSSQLGQHTLHFRCHLVTLTKTKSWTSFFSSLFIYIANLNTDLRKQFTAGIVRLGTVGNQQIFCVGDFIHQWHNNRNHTTNICHFNKSK